MANIGTYLLEGYLTIVTVALFISGIVQFLGPQWLNSKGTWERAPGWQREIAAWNFSLAAITVILLFGSDTYALRIIALGAVVLTGLLGTNHLHSVLKEQVPRWHYALVVLNYAGTIGGVGMLLLTL